MTTTITYHGTSCYFVESPRGRVLMDPFLTGSSSADVGPGEVGDPDVIVVGEIRDAETAEIAIQAAHTGHLVLSTLHTNDAPSTLERLRHMGVAPFQVASSVHLVVAQRLVRRLCVHCKKPSTDEPDIYQARGCAMCDQGYKGRVGIYQVMRVSTTLQQFILQGANAITLNTQAQQEGMRSLRQAGWRKVLQGVTSAQEVLSLTPDA